MTHGKLCRFVICHVQGVIVCPWQRIQYVLSPLMRHQYSCQLCVFVATTCKQLAPTSSILYIYSCQRLHRALTTPVKVYCTWHTV